MVRTSGFRFPLLTVLIFANSISSCSFRADQAVAVMLHFRSIKRRLLTLINPQMDECRKGKKDRNEKSAVYRSDPRVGERDTMETPDSGGDA